MFAEVAAFLPFGALRDVVHSVFNGHIGGGFSRAVEAAEGFFLEFPGVGSGECAAACCRIFSVNNGNSRQSQADHAGEKDDFDKEHKAEGVIEKLFPPVDAEPGEIDAGDGKSGHAAEPQNALMRGNASCKACGPHKNMDIENGAEEYDRRHEMDVADDKADDSMKRGGERRRFIEDPFRDGIAVSVSDVGKTRCCQRTARRFLVAEGTALARFTGVLLGGIQMGGADEQKGQKDKNRDAESFTRAHHPNPPEEGMRPA